MRQTDLDVTVHFCSQSLPNKKEFRPRGAVPLTQIFVFNVEAVKYSTAQPSTTLHTCTNVRLSHKKRGPLWGNEAIIVT
jgi:hypothetical protein